MRGWDKSYWTALVLFSGLAFFPLPLPSSFHMDQAKDPRFESVPFLVGDWKGKDVVLDERTYEILETRNVLSRVYERPSGETLHLLLVGSHRDRRVTHPPEVCYLGSNFSILNEKKSQIQTKQGMIPVKEFLARNEKNPQHQEHVLYVYRVGDRFTTNYYDQQLQFLWNRMRRHNSEVLLIRLAASDKARLQEFLNDLLPLLR